MRSLTPDPSAVIVGISAKEASIPTISADGSRGGAERLAVHVAADEGLYLFVGDVVCVLLGRRLHEVA